MKHRRMLAAAAALVMLTSTACGAKKNETATLTEEAPVMYDNADGEAAKGDISGADVAGAAADDAAPEAAAGAADVPAIYAEREAMADAAAGDSVGAFKSSAKSDSLAPRTGSDISDDDIAEPIAPEPAPVETDVPVSRPEAGILTAGEWRDHENWGFFSNLVKSEAIAFPSFGLDPCHRVSVDLTDAAGAPLPNAQVTLLDKGGKELWKSVTDKNGKAYLFEMNGAHGTSVKAVCGGAEASADVPASTDGTQGGAAACTDRAVTVKLDAAAAANKKTQIMFIVDTTGSMSDEMLYLQSDFTAIAGEVGDADTQYSALFYKDEGDTYVTRGEGFTSDTDAIKKQLNAETADGGGDEPEAVAEAFTQAFVSENWQDDAVKVAFLIYDAPPHDGKEAELETAVKAASEKGIRLVPIVSSNGSRETELFGRACAILTNGSYVFLTDHSGVGGSHLEPIIGDYKVEKLHDIIVRVIQEYKQ
ncbi:MAG: VWA domain-containing protein [Oscillospiraceae bacterium]|nr:VWA domain-containing protein [Oscillospiraceae bacterium]